MLGPLRRVWRRAGKATTSPPANEIAPPATTEQSQPAWQALPPIRRSAVAHPVTSDATGFARGLGARSPAPLVLRAPAHDVTPFAAGGSFRPLATTPVPGTGAVYRSAADRTPGTAPDPVPYLVADLMSRAPTAGGRRRSDASAEGSGRPAGPAWQAGPVAPTETAGSVAPAGSATPVGSAVPPVPPMPAVESGPVGLVTEPPAALPGPPRPRTLAAATVPPVVTRSASPLPAPMVRSLDRRARPAGAPPQPHLPTAGPSAAQPPVVQASPPSTATTSPATSVREMTGLAGGPRWHPPSDSAASQPATPHPSRRGWVIEAPSVARRAAEPVAEPPSPRRYGLGLPVARRPAGLPGPEVPVPGPAAPVPADRSAPAGAAADPPLFAPTPSELPAVPPPTADARTYGPRADGLADAADPPSVPVRAVPPATPVTRAASQPDRGPGRGAEPPAPAAPSVAVEPFSVVEPPVSAPPSWVAAPTVGAGPRIVPSPRPDAAAVARRSPEVSASMVTSPTDAPAAAVHRSVDRSLPEAGPAADASVRTGPLPARPAPAAARAVVQPTPRPTGAALVDSFTADLLAAGADHPARSVVTAVAPVRRLGLGAPVHRSAVTTSLPAPLGAPLGAPWTRPVGSAATAVTATAAGGVVAADESRGPVRFTARAPEFGGPAFVTSSHAVAREATPMVEEALAAPAPAPMAAASAPVAGASAAGGSTSAAGGAAGAHPAAGVPDSEIPGLAEKIYEHLARRLRAELLADRERRGLLGDPL
ncbi:hypothetical protein BBK14_21630 [Parafrankia soli]|uniref:Uncharacterized protein n=1 Tax=Parafrankia soli TaxID=2599596 RepID=A0A1S1PWP5_9ACTN|nr:hypothetical protein [Parafrankia soli]OHV25736.1 hypothetical protein BBK14_21630 [Parafrankia soli]